MKNKSNCGSCWYVDRENFKEDKEVGWCLCEKHQKQYDECMKGNCVCGKLSKCCNAEKKIIYSDDDEVLNELCSKCWKDFIEK